MRVGLTGVRNAMLAVPVAVVTLVLSGPACANATALGKVSSPTSTPPGDRIVVDVKTVNGSGCPAGTATVTPFSDNTGFRVTYRSYRVRVGGGGTIVDSRKNCQLGLQVHVPQGFTFAIAEAEYGGRAHLADGVSGLERANYYFQGSPDNNYVDHPFDGPINGPWRTTDITPVEALVFAPCGVSRILNVNTELRLTVGTSDPRIVSFMSMTSTEGNIDTIYHFAWRNCP
jgi:Domain of unknown function (DUF4360)